MTTFLQILQAKDKEGTLLSSIRSVKNGENPHNLYELDVPEISNIPGSPFAYWAGSNVRKIFHRCPKYECGNRTVKQGLATADDFRFLRLWWECSNSTNIWVPFAKGGTHSPYYADVYMVVNWRNNGYELRNFINPETGKTYSRPQNIDYYFRPGMFQTLRAANLAPHLTPPGACFGHNGFQAFCETEYLLAYLGVLNSSSCEYLFKMLLGRYGYALYLPGTLQATPFPELTENDLINLSELVTESWHKYRTLDTVEETSHAFLLPPALRERLSVYKPNSTIKQIEEIQSKIDKIVQEKYGLVENDLTPFGIDGSQLEKEETSINEYDIADDLQSSAQISLLSWCVGVAYGRFDYRLAIDEQQPPSEPGPLDPLPYNSPGILPDGAKPFHDNQGILLDDPGHKCDLSQIVESILGWVDMQTPDNLRSWLQKDFFKEHLKQYSKSRRQAPIYWPLSTLSSSYTLWIYYPELDDQTLYTAVNDFLEPKLKLVGDELNSLRVQPNRSSAKELELEKRQDLEQDLIELRDTILEIAPKYKPHLDDGVQITAAPLWPLFRHKPWQKVLKDTWEKLEAGDYDWSHLAYSYWPERVCEKCKADKSLAIAHVLEELYEEPAA